MRKRILAFILTAALGASLLTGCGGTGSSTGGSTGGNSDSDTVDTANLKDEVHVAMGVEPETLDCHKQGLVAGRQIGRYIYEGLVELNSSYEPMPQLAESIENNEDYSEYTFYLRQGVLFHNGKEMTSEDVVASLNRWIENCATAQTILSDGQQFEAVDDYTVKISIGKPCYTFLEVLASPTFFAGIMPKEVVDEATDKGVQEYIGTGPMKFVEWKSNQYVLLEKNEDYEGPGYEIDGDAGDRIINFSKAYIDFVPDSMTRLSGLQTGEYDIATSIPYDNLSEIQSNDSLVDYKEMAGTMYLEMNKAIAPFDDVKMRTAVRTALDVDEIMAGAIPSADYYDINSCFMIRDQAAWFTDSTADYMKVNDTEAAKKLLEEAGYNGEEIIITTSQDYPELYNASLVIKSQLEAAGFNVTLNAYDFATSLGQTFDPESTTNLWVMLYPPTPTPTSNVLITTDLHSGHADLSDITGLLDSLNSAKDSTEALSIYEQIQETAYADENVYALADYYNVLATTDKVKNFDSFMGFCLWSMQVEQ